MNLGLAGQVAVVLGGANGIGRAIAAGFAAEGAGVAVLDRDPRAETTARELADRHGVPAVGLAVDATDDAGLAAAAGKVVDTLGRYDHVVHAVGAGSGKFGFPFWNLAPADWPRVLELNLTTAVRAATAFAPHLREKRSGTLLFLSSVAGQIGSQTDPPYSAAKAGLINFAQCAARDLAPVGVRVNTVCPGMVRTDLNRSVWEAWARQQPADKRQSYEEWAGEKVRRVVPLGRWQEPEDVAALAVFLASVRARNITGQTMNVDGGFVMHW